MTTQLKQRIEKLYAEDFILWLDETLNHLHKREIENLDWEQEVVVFYSDTISNK